MATSPRFVCHALRSKIGVVFIGFSLLLVFLVYGVSSHKLTIPELNTVFLALVSTVWFSCFDVIGYHILLSRKKDGTAPKSIEAWYRILQTTVQHIITITLLLIDFQSAIWYVMLWWVGMCDWFYYVLIDYDFNFDEMSWLWWSFTGLLIGETSSSSVRIATYTALLAMVLHAVLRFTSH